MTHQNPFDLIARAMRLLADQLAPRLSLEQKEALEAATI